MRNIISSFPDLCKESTTSHCVTKCQPKCILVIVCLLCSVNLHERETTPIHAIFGGYVRTTGESFLFQLWKYCPLELLTTVLYVLQ